MIRKPTIEDREGWEKLFQAYRAFYGKEECSEAARRVWHWMGNLSEDFHGVLAIEDDQIVGLAHYHPTLHSLTGTRTLILNDLFVAEGHRRKGIGKKLLLHVCEQAKRMECARVRWMTEEDNLASRQLYDQIGTNIPFTLYDVNLQATLVGRQG